MEHSFSFRLTGGSICPKMLKIKKRLRKGNLIRSESYIYYEIIRLTRQTHRMKPINLKWYALAAALVAIITSTAWKSAGSVQPVKPFTMRHVEDTTAPRKKIMEKKERDYKISEVDQAMKELDKAMVDMDKNIKIDFSKMDKEIKLAMDEIKKIDFEKIGREVEASLKEVNWEKTRAEVDKALIEAEVKIKEVDMKKIRKELEAVKENINIDKIKSHIDIEKIQKSVHEGLAKARTGIESAKKELGLLKEFTEALEKDGLISKKKGYKINIKNNEMYINGAKQSQEVNEKYRKYFKDGNYTLSSDGDEISTL